MPTLSLRASSTFLLLFLVAGCSGSTAGVGSSSGSAGAGDALFAAPVGDATPSSIYGVWGGSMEEGGITFDTRWRFRASELALATRCSLRDGRESDTVSVTVRARVTDDEIAILESQKDEKRSGDFVCRANAQPRTLSACTGREGFERECFRLAGTTLTIYDSPVEKLELVKLSD